MSYWVQLFLWVAGFVISDYFRQRLPSQTPSGIGDFNIPTATEGRVVPIIPGGTVRINAPNCVWYGDFAAVERTVTTGVIFQDEETIGFTYELALQYALFKGEAAGISGVWIGDDKVWDADTDNAGDPSMVVDVDRPDLFGGEGNGGGFSGRLRLFPGTEDQAVSAFLASRLDPLPAYRGTCYVMVTSLDETAGATIGESNTLRYIRVEVQTFDTDANGGLGDALNLGDDRHFIGKDANPIDVAWRLYTNNRWGRGFAPVELDQASFEAARLTCYDEGIGFTQLIDELTTTGDMQDTIEQHVDGYIGPNPITGQIEVKLARQDYDPLTEFQATDANLVAVKKWSKGDWSQTKNRIRVRYTDRAKDWKETHAIELAPGNRIIQGRTVTEEVRFQGCHTASVAQALAARTKRGQSQPAASGSLTLDRTAWQLRPGSVLVLTSTKARETARACRVTKVAVGSVVANTIDVDVVADIFGDETPTIAAPPPSQFVPPVQQVVAFDAADQAITEAPLILSRYDPEPTGFPRVVTLARRASGNNPTEYEVVTRDSAGTPAGAFESKAFIRQGFMTVGQLREDLGGWQSGNGALAIQVDPIAGSLDQLAGEYFPSSASAEGVCVLEPGTDREEWLAVRNIVTDLGGIRLESVYRACMDTGMWPHPAGTRVWFVWTGGLGLVPSTYPVGNNVDVKLLPRSPDSEVAEVDATTMALKLYENPGPRYNAPLPPYRATLNGDEFPSEADFEEIQTSPSATGVRVQPTLRDFRQPDVLLSVQGVAQDGTGFNPDDVQAQGLAVRWELLNLDTGDTMAQSAGFVTAVAANDPFDMLLSSVIAAGATGFRFPARLIIETRHSPVAVEPVPQLAFQLFQFDFDALGIFSLEAVDTVLALTFDGADGQTTFDTGTAFPNQDVRFIGNAQLDDSVAPAIGTTALQLDGAGDAVQVQHPKGFNLGNDDSWSVEFRVRFNSVATDQVLVGQTGPVPWRSWFLQLEQSTGNLLFFYSSSGAAAYASINLGTWSPAIDTWYAVRVVQRRNGTSSRDWSAYVDGSRIGTSTSNAQPARSSIAWTVGARWLDVGSFDLELDGRLEQLRVYQAAITNPDATTYSVPTDPVVPARGAVVPLIANFDGVDGATTDNTDDFNAWQLTFGATTQLDTAWSQFGTASLLCNGVNNTLPASADGAWLPATVSAPEPVQQFSFKRGDFTVACFVRFAALPSSTPRGMTLVSKENTDANRTDWRLWLNQSDQLVFTWSPTGLEVDNVETAVGVGALAINTAYHVAAQRRGDALELYFNGSRVASVAGHFDGQAIGNDRFSPVGLGRGYDGDTADETRALNGWLDAVLIEKRAIFEGVTYTVPTAAPDRLDAPGRELVLLESFDGTTSFSTDNAIATEDLFGSSLVFQGNTCRLDTNTKQFGESALLVGSSADFLEITPSRRFDLDAGDFTIELWVRRSGATDASGLAFVNQWIAAGDRRSWRLGYDQVNDRLEFVWTTDGTSATKKRAYVAGFGDPAAVFTLYTVERVGANLHLYVDGVLQSLDAGSDSIGADSIPGFDLAPVRIGFQDSADYDGEGATMFVDDLRIQKKAAYSGSSFTAPTEAFPRPVYPY